MKVTIKIDGGSKPNPGESACAAVVYGDDRQLPIYTKAKWLGMHVTNNVAEHEGLILALKCAIELKATIVHVETDSRVVSNHFNGSWKVQNVALAHLITVERRLAKKIKKLTVRWVGRENVWPAHRLVDAEISMQRKLRADDYATPERRIFLDVENFLAHNEIYIKQRTDFAFFTASAAIVPIGSYTKSNDWVTPSLGKYWQDIQLLNEHQPVIIAWRPYGDSLKVLPAKKIYSFRPIRNWDDGGAELMMSYADTLTNHLIPAREMIWWTV